MLTPGQLAEQLNRYHYVIDLIGHQQTEPNWHHQPRIHRHHSLWLIVKGRGEFTIDGTTYPAEPGKLFFFIPDMVVERTTAPDEPLEFYFVRFYYTAAYRHQEQWILEPKPKDTFPLTGMITLHNTLPFITMIEQLYSTYQHRGHIRSMRRRVMFQEFLILLVQDLRAQKISGDTTAAIELTQDYMIEHYHELQTLEQLAQMAGLSVSHYSRLFKKTVGYSPIDYLTHLRMDRARELLILSDYRFKTIANSVGYQDEFYFSRVFKKVIGLSPRDYLKLHKVKLKGNKSENTSLDS